MNIRHLNPLILFILSSALISCTYNDANLHETYPDGYNHLSISSESMNSEYLFKFRDPNHTFFYDVPGDTVFVQLRFYNRALSYKWQEQFYMKFLFSKSHNTVFEATLFATAPYIKEDGDTSSVSIGKMVPYTMGAIERFAPVIVKVSNVHYSEKDNRISFDYTTEVHESGNSLKEILKLKGSLMAKCNK